LSSVASRSQLDRITKQTLTVLLSVSIVGALALYLAAPILMGLTFRFSESTPLLRILSLSLPAIITHSILRTSLFSLHQERAVAIVFGVACVLNILLNIAFIPQFGAMGAAVISTFTEYSIVGMYGVLYFKKVVIRAAAME
jgi:O-antigen/teichoic acid export membrane protein